LATEVLAPAFAGQLPEIARNDVSRRPFGTMSPQSPVPLSCDVVMRHGMPHGACGVRAPSHGSGHEDRRGGNAMANHPRREPLSPAFVLTNVGTHSCLVGAKATSLRAAAAQQLCSTNPHEPSRPRPALVRSPATQGFVVGAVAGIPRWHASGQKIEVGVSQESRERLRAPGCVDQDRRPSWGEPLAGS
jgi:hypothetical protein